jgi:hypothetical protein
MSEGLFYLFYFIFYLSILSPLQLSTFQFISEKPRKMPLLETLNFVTKYQTVKLNHFFINLNRLDACELRRILNLENECENGGSCIHNKITNEIRCLCKPGYAGSRCQMLVDHCQNSPCKYGKCKNEENTYKCMCSRGWQGRDCDVEKNLCNLEQDCVSENTQSVYNSLLSTVSCVCECKPGFTGERCETNIDDCLMNRVICANNGTCVDLVDDFECQCEPGFTGLICNEQVLNCDINPCKYGHCEMLGSQLKCVCDKGYTGKFCEIFIDKCKLNPCENGGTCHNLIDDYICECPSDFGTSRNCTERYIDPCSISPCLNNGSCTSVRELNSDRTKNIFTSFHCECRDSFRGKFCEIQNDLCSSNPCQNRGQCFLSRDKTNYECRCYAAFTGKNCESYMDWCMTPNACFNGGTCYNTANGYKCQCPHRFKGEKCEELYNPCDLMDCQNGGKCVLNDNIPFCKCQINRFIGTRCEIGRQLTKFK